MDIGQKECLRGEKIISDSVSQLQIFHRQLVRNKTGATMVRTEPMYQTVIALLTRVFGGQWPAILMPNLFSP